MTKEVQQELHMEAQRRQNYRLLRQQKPTRQDDRRPIHAVDACRVATEILTKLDNENTHDKTP